MSRTSMAPTLACCLSLFFATRAIGAAGDEHWSTAFDLPGLNGAVYSLLEFPSGIIVAGGDFTTAGGIAASHIAAWNGSGWSPLGSGTDGAVRALTVFNGLLIAGGDFVTAGGVPANHVAAWDGTAWSSLGPGIDGPVYSLIVWQSSLIAGESHPAGLDGGALRWDGVSWPRMEGGPTAGVNALCIFQGLLYAGGYFQSIGSGSARFVAKYDGSAWSAVGSGTSSAVYSLAVHAGQLHAGGTRFVVRWDGTNWVSLASSNIYRVSALCSLGGDLYAGGTARSHYADAIARWDGTSWNAVGGGILGPCPEVTMPYNPVVNALCPTSVGLVAGGWFSQAGAVGANDVARWDGAAWHAFDAPQVGFGLDCDVNALAFYQGRLVAGGCFTHAGGCSASHIARWDGEQWRPLGVGVDSSVYSLQVFGDDLVAGGDFGVAGGVTAHRIARWDGTAWHAMGTGVEMTHAVWAMAVWRNELYAVSELQGVARWTGSSWSFLPPPPETVGRQLAVYHDELVLSAWIQDGRIAAWNGSSWRLLGSGMSYPPFDEILVNAMTVAGDRLFVGGEFTVPGSFIAQWDGSSWGPVGSGVDGPVSSVGTYRGDLVVGGLFTQAGGIPARLIARWDGSTWSAFGSGLPSTGDSPGPRAFLDVDQTLHVGGRFWTAGVSPSWNFADWVESDMSSVAGGHVGGGLSGRESPLTVTLSPNPFSGEVRFFCDLERRSEVRAQVLDVRGRVMATFVDRDLPAGRHVISWSGRDEQGRLMAPGVYLARVEADGVASTLKVILER